MLRRKTIIVLTITFMMTAMVTAFSYLYISQILRLRIDSADETAKQLTRQLAYAADNDLPDFSSTAIDVNSAAAVRHAVIDYLQDDVDLNNMLQSARGSWTFVMDAAIIGPGGKALLHTDANMVGKVVPLRPDFQNVLSARFPDQLRIIFGPPTVYDVSYDLRLTSLRSTDSDEPFGTIRIGVSPVFLKREINLKIMHSLYFSVAAIFLSLLLSAGISNLALGPLKAISRDLDSMAGGEQSDLSPGSARHDEYGLVTLKIANLGRQIRDTREIFSALKDNVDQLMSKLQDGLMLFARDSRVVLVSAPVEAFLGRPRSELLGRPVSEVFDRNSRVGAALLDAFERKRPIAQREFQAPSGKRVQVSFDFVQEKNSQIGALLIMRDTESVQRIGDEIEMSRRLSASSRLTRGVAHEVKNPINAIVLHLQLLRNKLSKQEPDTRRHMDIIDNEIHRLDRVVQTLVDFTRPRDLHIEEVDLRRLLDEVAQLAGPDAEQHGVTIQRQRAPQSLPVKVDVDLMKQALLNVVINGVQAMAQGGQLSISARREQSLIIAEVTDQGAGIPPEVQDKIFELYFTTKKEGSGIGLAQTYQILQWHYGSVDFESNEGVGTTFRFHIPMAEPTVQTIPQVAAGAGSQRGT